ncbi:hypothetical protein [Spiroplasma endosymbiont of Phycita roborella]|uniref:hypothetical protein n=2 Tax=unclassified Spiroplasma TaxID=2637901 RepID=UPI00313EA745
MINNQEQYKKIITIALNAIGAGSAGATTKLLHNARQVSQWLNLANALNRGVFGTAFTFLPDSKKVATLIEVWKILTNTSYIVTTLDVNFIKTIFTKASNWDLTIPNLLPFISFEISAISGVLAGTTTLTRIYFTNKDSTTNKILKSIEDGFNLLCPFAAVIGGGSLFWTPGLDSKIIAPIFATLDGVSGTTNWLINKFWNAIDFETNNENQSILDNEENGTLLINDEEFKTRCNETNIDNDSSSLNSVNSVFVAN